MVYFCIILLLLQVAVRYLGTIYFPRQTTAAHSAKGDDENEDRSPLKEEGDGASWPNVTVPCVKRDAPSLEA